MRRWTTAVKRDTVAGGGFTAAVVLAYLERSGAGGLRFSAAVYRTDSCIAVQITPLQATALPVTLSTDCISTLHRDGHSHSDSRSANSDHAMVRLRGRAGSGTVNVPDHVICQTFLPKCTIVGVR